MAILHARPLRSAFAQQIIASGRVVGIVWLTPCPRLCLDLALAALAFVLIALALRTLPLLPLLVVLALVLALLTLPLLFVFVLALVHAFVFAFALGLLGVGSVVDRSQRANCCAQLFIIEVSLVIRHGRSL